MPIDYSSADRVLALSFEKLDRTAKMEFPAPGTLSKEFATLLNGSGIPILPHNRWEMLASASVEMWHRAIHSFLWSVALTRTSPLWASVSGYYASHFVMRAFAHSMGFFKSFKIRKTTQIIIAHGQFTLSDVGIRDNGEHAFYWKVTKGHPKFAKDPLFRENSERDENSDSSHRNFGNYTDHVNSFTPIKLPNTEEIVAYIEKLSHIRLGSVTEPSRDNYPDLQNVQILAFQRIVAFNDFLEERIPKNRFWRAHRRPTWCRDVMRFQIEDSSIEAPSSV